MRAYKHYSIIRANILHLSASNNWDDTEARDNASFYFTCLPYVVTFWIFDKYPIQFRPEVSRYSSHKKYRKTLEKLSSVLFFFFYTHVYRRVTCFNVTADGVSLPATTHNALVGWLMFVSAGRSSYDRSSACQGLANLDPANRVTTGSRVVSSVGRPSCCEGSQTAVFRENPRAVAT